MGSGSGSGFGFGFGFGIVNPNPTPNPNPDQVLLGLNAAEIGHCDWAQFKQAEVYRHYSALVQEQAYRGRLPVTRHAQSR